MMREKMFKIHPKMRSIQFSSLVISDRTQSAGYEGHCTLTFEREAFTATHGD